MIFTFQQKKKSYKKLVIKLINKFKIKINIVKSAIIK